MVTLVISQHRLATIITSTVLPLHISQGPVHILLCPLLVLQGVQQEGEELAPVLLLAKPRGREMSRNCLGLIELLLLSLRDLNTLCRLISTGWAFPFLVVTTWDWNILVLNKACRTEIM